MTILFRRIFCTFNLFLKPTKIYMKYTIIIIALFFSCMSFAQVMGGFEGEIKSTTLEGSGDRNVVADPDGVLKIGASLDGLPGNPSSGEMIYYDGTTWQTVSAGTQGQTLTFCNGVPIWGDCPVLFISAHATEQITDTSAKIRWTTSDYVQAYVEYGITTSYGLETSEELSFDYATHLQPLLDLQPGTTYYYRVHSTSASGETASEDGSFMTTGGTVCGNDIIEEGEECDDGNSIDGDGCNSSCQAEGASITSHVAEQITNTSAKIRWATTENVQGYVEYGTTTNYGQQTSVETTFNYAEHLQTITGLQPGTIYYYRVHSITQSGVEIVASGSFSTTGSGFLTECNDGIDNDGDGLIDLNDTDCTNASDNSESTQLGVSGWPSSANGYDENLPMSGIFYGVTKSGLQVGNSPISLENSIRFRAQRTGNIDAVRYNNRIFSDNEMVQRCNNPAYGGSSQQKYCDCIDAGLTANQCAFTLSNSYHVGTGGLQTIKIHPDDETDAHEPTTVVLGQTNQFIPTQLNSEYPIIPLQSPVYVEAGKMYHLHFENATPPSCNNGGDSNYGFNTVAEAQTCTGGAIGINGMYYPTMGESVGGDAEVYGPFLGSAGGVLRRSSPTGAWQNAINTVGFHEVRYESDGTWIGEATVGAANTGNGGALTSGSQFIEGDNKGRQVFTVRDVSRTVNGLWVSFGHSANMVSGQPMTVKVQDANGTVLATGSIPYSETCMTAATTGLKYDIVCQAWGYTDLSSTLMLQQGTTYMVEFSAPANAGFRLPTHFPLNYSPWNSTNLNEWKDSNAQYKRGASAQWGAWSTWSNGSGNAWPERDIPILFTQEGMPKSLE